MDNVQIAQELRRIARDLSGAKKLNPPRYKNDSIDKFVNQLFENVHIIMFTLDDLQSALDSDDEDRDEYVQEALKDLKGNGGVAVLGDTIRLISQLENKII